MWSILQTKPHDSSDVEIDPSLGMDNENDNQGNSENYIYIYIPVDYLEIDDECMN